MFSVWFGFGSATNQNQTKTKPNPYQNHTIPLKSTGFWYGFEAEPASNLNKKRTKNRTNNYVLYVLRCTKILKPFSLILGEFLVQIWSWFGFKTIQKNSTFLWYGFGMVLVWFWFGFGLVWSRTKTIPNRKHTKRICLCTYARTDNEYDGIIRYFLKLNLSGNWLSQKPLCYYSCTTELL